MRVLIAFGVGMAVGAVSAWMYLTEKYKHLMDGVEMVDGSDIDEEVVLQGNVKSNTDYNNATKSYTTSITLEEQEVEKIEPKKEATPSSIIRKVAQKVDYNKAAEIATDVALAAIDPSEKECPQDSSASKPYKISPTEFDDEKQFYDKISLVYFLGDGVLALHPDEVLREDEGEKDTIDDVEGTVGLENLKAFGEYEPGMLYVRNEEFGADYRIELKYGKYSNGVHMK